MHSSTFNLSGRCWNDPYSLIISLYKKNRDVDPSLTTLLKREYLKKFIMTVGYNARSDTCRTYFYESILTQGVVDHINLIGSKKEDVDKLSTDIFNFIKLDLFHEFYERSISDIINELDIANIELGDCSLNLTYLKKAAKPRRKKHTYQYKKWYLSSLDLLESEDRAKQLRAFEPNLIHAYDAMLARYLVKNVSCYSVHDSFSTSLYDLHNLMDHCNLFFRECPSLSLPADNYSLFILL